MVVPVWKAINRWGTQRAYQSSPLNAAMVVIVEVRMKSMTLNGLFRPEFLLTLLLVVVLLLLLTHSLIGMVLVQEFEKCK